jgi:hypothetical protein
MRNSKYILRLLIMVSMLPALDKTYAQGDTVYTGRGQYALVAYIGGGMGFYTENAGTPVNVKAITTRRGFVGSIRVLWHPDHLLRVGLETGHMTFYSYTFADSIGTKGKTALTAIPLLLVASMPVTARLNAFFGTGFYNVTSNLNYAGKASASKLSVGWMLAASYVHPITKDLGLGAELKWMDAAQTSDASIVGQLQLVWKFMKW